MKVTGYNLGCKVNKYELEAVLEIFEKNNYEVVSFNDFADVYIISTCAVTTLAEKKSRKIINRTKKINPNAITIALGCYIQKEIDVSKRDVSYKGLASVDIFLGTKEKSKVLDILNEYKMSNNRMHHVSDVSKYKDYENQEISKPYEMTRGYIKIQDGCNNFCSYCIIPYLRGRERSRNLKDIAQEAKRLSENGVKEVVLTGIEVASYGREFENVSLIDAIGEVLKIKSIERVRLSSLEQSIITDEFIDMARREERLCNHFHLSLQSGSNTVLLRMNRKYTKEDYRKKVEMLREGIEGVSITTDVITGFPEETDEEFEETYKFLEELELTNMHLFTYSVREGTKAASMKQVNPLKKRERLKRLEELNRKLNNKFLEKFIGNEVSVLVEQKEDGLFSGHTTNYIKVMLASENDLVNSIVTVKVREISNNILIGDIVNG